MEKQGGEPRIYLAPMEGITTYIFRRAIAKYYGGIDRYYTPFLTASHLKGRELRDVHPENNCGLDTVPQILTNDSELFLTITRQLAELRFREVNLNLGCPSGTVVSKGRGAGFLEEPEKLDRFLYEIFDGREKLSSGKTIDISIKTRLGMEFLSEWDDILRVYIKYPIKELIIHPRLRNEFYTGEVHLDIFMDSLKKLREASFTGDICYNGDIKDIEAYKRVISKFSSSLEAGVATGEKVMIGRGLVMNPNLANQIKEYALTNEDGSIKGEVVKVEKSFDKKKFTSFINELMEDYILEMSNEKQVVMKMKELWTYFSMGLGLSPKELKEIHKVSRLSDYKNAVQMILSGI